MATVRANARLPIAAAVAGRQPLESRVVTFDGLSRSDHLAICFGTPPRVPLVRVHSECVTGDVFGSLRCDCGTQLKGAIGRMQREAGWLLYLRQEGRGIGLAGKLDSYVLQESGIDTFEANRVLGFRDDERDYSDVALMLQALGIPEIDLLTGNFEKVQALRKLSVRVRHVLPCQGTECVSNSSYLAAKRARGLALAGT